LSSNHVNNEEIETAETKTIVGVKEKDENG
jgi:hypothetical protein